MRTSTLRRYTCSNASSGELGRPGDRALIATGRSRAVLTGALASVLMPLVAILASGCDIARPRRRPARQAWRLIPPLAEQAISTLDAEHPRARLAFLSDAEQGAGVVTEDGLGVVCADPGVVDV